MILVCWQADAKGSYRVDIALSSRVFSLMVDTGFVDAKSRVGFAVDSSIYDLMEQSGEFLHTSSISALDASGRRRVWPMGLIPAQRVHPKTRQRIGPLVQLYVLRGAPRVPSRVGTPFFHHLTGCRVIWDLDQRTWCVECP